MRDIEKIYHILYGLHSKIPICCIRAYIKNETIKTKKSKWEHMPCKKCHANKNYKKIHVCKGLCIALQMMIYSMIFRSVYRRAAGYEWNGKTWVRYFKTRDKDNNSVKLYID